VTSHVLITPAGWAQRPDLQSLKANFLVLALCRGPISSQYAKEQDSESHQTAEEAA
jgi:hypothetical protein